MSMRWFAVVAATLITWPGLATPSPVQGPFNRSRFELPAGFPLELEPIEFVGGKQACVIVVGDHDPVADIAIRVYDEGGQLVAQDVGTGDYAAAIWYPPRDGKYRISLENKQNLVNYCYLVIK